VYIKDHHYDHHHEEGLHNVGDSFEGYPWR
jgi:hypothetical protein